MYQGPITASDGAISEESSILRELRWTDLVARIAATRGSRAEIVVGPFAVDTSFAAFSREHREESQRTVNRDGLSHGKAHRLDTQDAAKSAEDCDREIK